MNINNKCNFTTAITKNLQPLDKKTLKNVSVNKEEYFASKQLSNEFKLIDKFSQDFFVKDNDTQSSEQYNDLYEKLRGLPDNISSIDLRQLSNKTGFKVIDILITRELLKVLGDAGIAKIDNEMNEGFDFREALFIAVDCGKKAEEVLRLLKKTLESIPYHIVVHKPN